MKAYKLLRRTRKGLKSLFIGSHVLPVGPWLSAEFIPTAGYAPRPGWHCAPRPHAPWLLKSDGTLAPDRVWAEVEVPSREVQQPPPEQPPVAGHYVFKRPSSQGGSWIIASDMRVVRLLTIR